MTVDGQFIAEQLEKALASDPWHGPATVSVLHGLSAQSAAATPVSHAHSAWAIVLHMTAWQREVYARLEGNVPSLPADGDWPEVPVPTAAAWRQACENLESSLRTLAQCVSRLTSDELVVMVGATRDRPLGTGVTRAEMLLGILQHNVYHTGQVALLRKALEV